MSNSNTRVKDYRTYHHLMSRIAHKVYFLTEEVRNDFIEMIRRAADFCGIELVAWCVMTNHFHLLAYLPEPKELDEDEVIRRYGVLKGEKRMKDLVSELSSLRQAKREADIQKKLDKIKSSMYHIGSFMKIVKQWMTQEYNTRYSHRGTLWEAVYKDVPVRALPDDLAKCAAYIHLNPIRAAITQDFAGYAWSSFTALKREDELALAGMRLIYGMATKEEIIEAHHRLMSTLLEQMKLERARDIARKRQAGLDAPIDPLTTEALVAQEEEHLKNVMNEFVDEKIIKRATRGRPSSLADLELAIRKHLETTGAVSIPAIVDETGYSRASVYRCLKQVRLASQNSRQ